MKSPTAWHLAWQHSNTLPLGVQNYDTLTLGGTEYPPPKSQSSNTPPSNIQILRGLTPGYVNLSLHGHCSARRDKSGRGGGGRTSGSMELWDKCFNVHIGKLLHIIEKAGNSQIIPRGAAAYFLFPICLFPQADCIYREGGPVKDWSWGWHCLGQTNGINNTGYRIRASKARKGLSCKSAPATAAFDVWCYHI